MKKEILYILVTIFVLTGSVNAVGFHQTSEVNPGMFQGDFSFNGSVGINTNSPAQDFHVAGNGNIALTDERKYGAGDKWQMNTKSDSLQIGWWNDSATDKWTDVMYLENDGDVGIGTDNPSSKLEVKDNVSNFNYSRNEISSNFPALATFTADAKDTTYGSSLLRFNSVTSAFGNSWGYFGTVQTDNRDNAFVWGQRSGGSNLSEQMRLTANSDLGVGTSYPDTRLQVEDDHGYSIGDITASGSGKATDWNNVGSLKISSSNNAVTLFASGDYNERAAFIQSGHASGGWSNHLGTLSLNPLGGNVGIGTKYPGVALDVIGSIEYTGSISDVSDKRLKENITPLENTESIISNISGVYFEMKNETLSNRTEVGVLAQDVEKVLPEVVTQDSKGYKAVDYSKLSVVAIEALKDQNERLEELERKNKELRYIVCKHHPQDCN